MKKTMHFATYLALAAACVAPLFGAPVAACAVVTGVLTLVAGVFAVIG